MTKYLLLILILLYALPMLAANLASIQDSYLAEAKGDYATALLQMQKLAQNDPNELFYSMRMAWLQYLLGSYQEAMKLYQVALNKLEHLDAHLGIINCQLALGQWEAALAKSAQLLPSHPHNTILLGKAAYAAFMQKNYSQAAEYYANILEIYPWDMENRGYLVNNLYLSGDLKTAKQQYTLLKKYAPNSEIVIAYQGTLDLP